MRPPTRQRLRRVEEQFAVLGGGHLKLYPTDHAALANEITHSGAVISESPPDTPPRSGSFPRRNRIVSGLSFRSGGC